MSRKILIATAAAIMLASTGLASARMPYVYGYAPYGSGGIPPGIYGYAPGYGPPGCFGPNCGLPGGHSRSDYFKPGNGDHGNDGGNGG
jgi:hypothetical protein